MIFAQSRFAFVARGTPSDHALTRPLRVRIIPYSHFFHLKIQYGTIAAISIMTIAIG